MNEPLLRWAVVLVDLDPSVGHEQAGERRAVVVSYEPLHRSGLMAICPITSARSAERFPGDVALPRGEASARAGVIICHQLRTLAIERVRRVSGRITDPAVRSAVRRYLARHVGLDIPPSEDGASGDEVFTRLV